MSLTTVCFFQVKGGRPRRQSVDRALSLYIFFYLLLRHMTMAIFFYKGKLFVIFAWIPSIRFKRAIYGDRKRPNSLADQGEAGGELYDAIQCCWHRD